MSTTSSKLEHFGNRYLMQLKLALRNVQEDALEKLILWFSSVHTENKTAVVVMPTGTGKTGVICCLPYVLMSQLPPGKIDTSKPILMITPGLDTLDELKTKLCGGLEVKSFLECIKVPIENNAKYSVHVIKSSLDVSKLGHQERNFDIVLSNAQKWRATGKASYENLSSDLFSIVVIDEAHYLPAKTWRKIVEKFSQYAKIVFFTATPYRTDGRPITIDGAVRTRGYAYHLPQEKAIEENLIRKVDMETLPWYSPEDSDKEKIFYSVDTQVIAKVKEFMETKNKKLLPGGQKHAAIIITDNIEKASEMRDRCMEVGFDDRFVKVVNSVEIENNAEKRSHAIKEIQNGKVQVVIIVKMLLEGFKYPPFSIAGILTKIRSPLKFAKLVGQIQRQVSHTHKDGRVTTEEGITGDIITHEYFQQSTLFMKFKSDYYMDEKYLNKVKLHGSTRENVESDANADDSPSDTDESNSDTNENGFHTNEMDFNPHESQGEINSDRDKTDLGGDAITLDTDRSADTSVIAPQTDESDFDRHESVQDTFETIPDTDQSTLETKNISLLEYLAAMSDISNDDSLEEGKIPSGEEKTAPQPC